jgi:hypothetical protein
MALKRGLRRKVSAHVVLLIVDEAIEERSGQVNFGRLYNAKGVSPWVAECSSPF